MKKKEENLDFGTRYNVVQKKQGHSTVGRSENVGEQTEIKGHLKEDAWILWLPKSEGAHMYPTGPTQVPSALRHSGTHDPP